MLRSTYIIASWTSLWALMSVFRFGWLVGHYFLKKARYLSYLLSLIFCNHPRIYIYILLSSFLSLFIYISFSLFLLSFLCISLSISLSRSLWNGYVYLKLVKLKRGSSIIFFRRNRIISIIFLSKKRNREQLSPLYEICLNIDVFW